MNSLTPPYRREAWYWFVAGDRTQVFSSASLSYVPLTDAGYEAFLANGCLTSVTSANDMLLTQIQIWEDKGTVRLQQEVAAGDTTPITGGEFAGMTPAEALAHIVAEKNALRAQLVAE